MQPGTSAQAKRLLWAGFFSIFAAGVGFSVRTRILGIWAEQYGFTLAELGGITGGGLVGFGIIIILGSLIADRIGYGKLMALAFVLHIVSAGLQMCTGPIHAAFGREATYWTLYLAMFIFAIANGTCEVVVNPMVATLFPNEKTHYLNILHAGWPGGLILGGLISYLMNGGKIGTWEPIGHVHWLIQMSLFLAPVFVYGALLVGQRLPRSEAGEAGVNLQTMLLELVAPVLLVLFIIHAMVGYVELGTDSWIASITGRIMYDASLGSLLFVYTSALMFLLRFCAGPIEKRISPLGLLFISGLLGFAGLTMLGYIEGKTQTVLVLCFIAATIYGLGKTFLWPTMLAVVSERFPHGGAITLGMVGGIGMLSAGLLGGPGIGFKQDYFAVQKIKEIAPATYDRYAAEKKDHFLGFEVRGLDGAKVGVVMDEGKELDKNLQIIEKEKRDDKAAEEYRKLQGWWESVGPYAKQDEKAIKESQLYGGQMAFRLTAFVPLTMAVLYLLLILYFRARGGYRRVELTTPGKRYIEDVEGPMQA